MCGARMYVNNPWGLGQREQKGRVEIDSVDFEGLLKTNFGILCQPLTFFFFFFPSFSIFCTVCTSNTSRVFCLTSEKKEKNVRDVILAPLINFTMYL